METVKDELLLLIAIVSGLPVSGVKGASAWLVLKLSPYVQYQFIANFTIMSSLTNR